MIHYDTLFQNARDIITKYDISLLQSASGFFVAKCHSFIAECDSYYKMQLLHYKMRHYYKMQRLLQIATVHILTIFLHLLKISCFLYLYSERLFIFIFL